MLRVEMLSTGDDVLHGALLNKSDLEYRVPWQRQVTTK